MPNYTSYNVSRLFTARKLKVSCSSRLRTSIRVRIGKYNRYNEQSLFKREPTTIWCLWIEARVITKNKTVMIAHPLQTKLIASSSFFFFFTVIQAAFLVANHSFVMTANKMSRRNFNCILEKATIEVRLCLGPLIHSACSALPPEPAAFFIS